MQTDKQPSAEHAGKKPDEPGAEQPTYAEGSSGNDARKKETLLRQQGVQRGGQQGNF